MDWLARTRRRIAILFGRTRAEREMDEEMRLHLQMEAEELVRQGLSPEEARRQARVAFGGVERFKEEARDARGTRLVEDLIMDARYALRTLTRSPGFTAVALLTLGLGIGATAAIFSALNGILLRPLPYGQPERVVRIAADFGGREDRDLSPAEYVDLRERLDVASAVGVYAFGTLNVMSGGEPEGVSVGFVSEGVLPAFGVAPAMGRNFSAAEAAEGATVLVLSDGYWRRRFGADPDIIGRAVVVNDTTATVIGVMPAGFALPEDFVSGQPVAMYGPLGIDPAGVDRGDRGSHFLDAVALLRPGVPFAVANEALVRQGQSMVEEFPTEYPQGMDFGLRAIPIREVVVGDVRPALLVLFGAVGFVLLIVCVNMANLLLARSDARRRELAMRAALGADRSRVVRQLLVESSVLALAGGALGILLAYWGLDILVALSPPNIPRLEQVGLDLRVLGFAVAVSLISGVAFGLYPALRVSRNRAAEQLREGGRGMAGHRSGEKSRRTLVVAEVALALVLLAGAGLFTRSFVELYTVEKGFISEGVLSVRVSPPFARYREEERIVGFWRTVIRDLSRQPGVVAAGATVNLPLQHRLGDMGFDIEGQSIPEDVSGPAADWLTVTPGYFQAMRIPLRRGRVIEERDGPEALGVAVINEEMAARHWPDGDPIGQRIRLGGEQTEPRWATIVGIVANVTHNGLDAEPRPQMYFAHQQFRFWSNGAPVYPMTIVARTQGEPAALAGTVRRVVREMDPQLPLGSFQTMEEVVSASVAQPRLIMALLLAFSSLALLLAAVGIYGVLSYSVGERRHELGVRLALGARTAEVAAMVVRHGLWLVGIGLVIGLAGALALTRLLEGLLYQTSAVDPLTLASVSLALALVAAVACYIPALRATRVDPMVSLRAE